ncbi:YfiR family protein [bacterium]|nr:YfiR family protein [bacterium]
MSRRIRSLPVSVGRGVLLLLFLTLGFTSPAHAQVGKGTASFTAWNLLKTLSMENSIAGKTTDISIHVIGDAEVAAELSSKVGETIGSATLKHVDSGYGLPSSPPDVIYIGNPDEYMIDSEKLRSLVDYARDNKVISVTYEPILIYKGVTLGIGAQESGTAKFMLNLQASKDQGLNWNKAFIKLAETI